MFTNLQNTTINFQGLGMGVHAEARQVAARLFDRLYGQAVISRLLGKLTGRASSLRTLSGQPRADARTLRTVIVPLDKIVGSEGRSDDFDACFRPLKWHNRERWISVAAARRTGVVLPAVELVQSGDEYYVRDGHHRISVARVSGQLEIDARIVN